MSGRPVLPIDAHAVRVCAARGLNIKDTALALGYVPNLLTLRIRRDAELRAEFESGAAEHEARVRYAEAHADAVEREGAMLKSWEQRLTVAEERQRNYEAHTAADRSLVYEELRRAEASMSQGEWHGLCRRELREKTGLDYRRINDVLDELIVDGLVRRLPDRNFVEYFAVKE